MTPGVTIRRRARLGGLRLGPPAGGRTRVLHAPFGQTVAVQINEFDCGFHAAAFVYFSLLDGEDGDAVLYNCG
jgi:hypothetical protein